MKFDNLRLTLDSFLTDHIGDYSSEEIGGMNVSCNRVSGIPFLIIKDNEGKIFAINLNKE